MRIMELNESEPTDEASLISADRFFAEKARYTIITALDRQIETLKDKGFSANILGKGESNSKMVVISRLEDINSI